MKSISFFRVVKKHFKSNEKIKKNDEYECHFDRTRTIFNTKRKEKETLTSFHL